MSSKKKAPKRTASNLHVVTRSGGRQAQVSDNSFEIGGRRWTVRPMNERGTEEAYDESAEFLLLVTPIVTRLFSSITGAGIAASNTNLTNAGPLEQMGFILEMAEDMGISSMLGEISNVLPRLVAIICHGEDDTVDVSDVKRWAGSPLNPQLWKAVMLQIKADNLLVKLAELGVVFMGGEATAAPADGTRSVLVDGAANDGYEASTPSRT